MAKIAILIVGYQRFALSPKTSVAAVLTALQTSEPVEYDYQSETHQKVYFPDPRRDIHIGIEFVDSSQLRSARPGCVPAARPVQIPPALHSGQLTLPASRRAS